VPRLPRPSRPRNPLAGRPPGFRRRAAAVAGVLSLYLLIRFAPLPGIPCGLSAVKDCDTEPAAISLVPADAYAYGHIELDTGDDQVAAAADLVAKLPDFEQILQGSAQAGGLSTGIDLRDQLEWVGDEAAFAVLPGRSGAPLPVALLEIGDEKGAEQFAGQSGLASARRGGFLVLGDGAAVGTSTAAESGAESLEDDPAAADVLGALPDDRLADAYVSEDGVDQLLQGRGGLAAQLDTFADYGASTGIGAALVAADDGIALHLHSALDPERVEAAPGFFTAFPSFEPGLADALAPDTLAALSIGDPSKTVRSLLEQADAAVPGIAGAFDRLNADLQRQGAVDLERGLLPLLDGEAVAAVAPGGRIPYVTMVFDDVEEAPVREAVARLQGPLIAAIDPARSGVAPTFSQRRVDDVVVRGLRLAPGVDLTYAIFDGRLVIATDSRGVEQAIEGEDSLAGTDSFETAAAGSTDGVSALVFLNLQGLVELAEPIGLAEIVAGFRSDLERLKALGLTTRSDEDSLDTEIFLEIR